MFFQLTPQRAMLCDSLEALTWAFANIRDDVMQVHKHLPIISKGSNSKNHYELLRDRFNSLLSRGEYNAEFTALFIYLNKAGFNGLWRQNRNGEFNVPFGDHSNLRMPNLGELLQASKILQNAVISTMTYPKEVFKVINGATAGDVIFADPPYLDTFQGYDGIFESGKEFHEELAIVLWQAVRRGVTVFVTNNDCPETRRWYGAFTEIETYNRSQSVAGTVEGRKRWNQILAIGIP